MSAYIRVVVDRFLTVGKERDKDKYRKGEGITNTKRGDTSLWY